MMRLVVLLCAEERKLLLLGEPIYDQNYAVSTLRARLREDKERLGDEVLERRHDAWSRLLAVFRAVFGGIEHETLRLPALGGSLFDPDRFPFLEGRATGTSWRDTPSLPLPIDNRTVLMLLTALQVLEQRTGALLLSYEALDVEQIGHVYEGLLERTVKRVPETTLGLIGSQKAVNPNIPLSELEEAKANGDAKLLAYLLEKTGRSESGLKSALAKQVDEPLYHRVLLACGSDIPLADRIKPWSLLLRTDSWGDPLAYRENSFIVTLGAGRRETGTHYTPKTLTEPIVQHTLEPLVYVGTSEGKPQTEWLLKSSREILALKVCDMAMGSAAFLVQTCRWLGDRLVEAWDAAEKTGRAVSVEGEVLEQSGNTELLPRDRAERVLIARRLIASRCLYGVDKNPMAVELAKVSLWLITMMKGRPFSFLDHALKCGDSLLGVSSLKQIENFSLRPGERQVTFATANLFRYVEEASKKRRDLEDLPSNDYTQIEAKSRLNNEAEMATAKVKSLADCLIAFELRGLDGEQYAQQRAIAADHAEVAMRKSLSEFEAYARQQLCGRRPFHWPTEFPEVSAGGGFDAFVGNPPYMGGAKLETAFGSDYRALIVSRIANGITGTRGTADLATYFLLRAESLTRNEGMLGLIVTNSLGQGDAREVGLSQVLNRGHSIVRSVPSSCWPGKATVFYAMVWVYVGQWRGNYFVDGNGTSGIDASMSAAESTSVPPDKLKANEDIAFEGAKLSGEGFVVSNKRAQDILERDSRNARVLRPYLTGALLNNQPILTPDDYIITFLDWPLSRQSAPEDYDGPVAYDFPECIEWVEKNVKPQRDKLPPTTPWNRKLRESWWHFGQWRWALDESLTKVEKALVLSRVTPHVMVEWAEKTWVFSDRLTVFATDKTGMFGLLQSSFHDVWSWRYGTTNLSLLSYSPAACFLTLPIANELNGLESISQRYHNHRRLVKEAHDAGLTDTYNRFHDPEDQSENVALLRTLHVDLDQAVAAAYGWNDLELGHGFHKTKQGMRFTISETARRTVLDRLLQLNHERHEEEVKAGLHDKGAKKGKGKKAAPLEKELFG
jgi:hypothetical protein